MRRAEVARVACVLLVAGWWPGVGARLAADLTSACISSPTSDLEGGGTLKSGWPPQTSTELCKRCVKANSKSQHGEDRHVLPELWNASGHRPGTFVELGAFDGVRMSNTYLLEKCFGWNGVLVEASSANFAKLRRSGRAGSKCVHSAVCAGPPSTVRMTVARDGGGMVAGQLELMSRPFRKLHRHMFNGTEQVPCRSLTAIMAGAGYDRATFLSLDVEGAEDRVLQAVDPRAFRLVLVEWAQWEEEKNERVHRRLASAGMRLQGQWQHGLIREGGRSRLYVAPDSGVYPRDL